MFKKFFLVLFLFFFLVSCGEDLDLASSSSSLVVANMNGASIKVPSNWEIINNKDEVLPKPKDSKIELVVTAKNTKNGFSNNLLILSNPLEKFTTSKDFSMLNNIGAETDYLEYNKIESKEFKFLDEELSQLYIFEAKYNIDTPRVKFLQTAHICNQNKAYFLTLAISTSISDTSKYEQLLSTFNCETFKK